MPKRNSAMMENVDNCQALLERIDGTEDCRRLKYKAGQKRQTIIVSVAERRRGGLSTSMSL